MMGAVTTSLAHDACMPYALKNQNNLLKVMIFNHVFKTSTLYICNVQAGVKVCKNTDVHI